MSAQRYITTIRHCPVCGSDRSLFQPPHPSIAHYVCGAKFIAIGADVLVVSNCPAPSQVAARAIEEEAKKHGAVA
jgi:hypothetical protein